MKDSGDILVRPGTRQDIETEFVHSSEPIELGH